MRAARSLASSADCWAFLASDRACSARRRAVFALRSALLAVLSALLAVCSAELAVAFASSIAALSVVAQPAVMVAASTNPAIVNLRMSKIPLLVVILPVVQKFWIDNILLNRVRRIIAGFGNSVKHSRQEC